MANDVLWDREIAFYQHGCITDGQFDADKARALGFSDAQLPIIQQALVDNGWLAADEVDTQDLPESPEASEPAESTEPEE